MKPDRLIARRMASLRTAMEAEIARQDRAAGNRAVETIIADYYSDERLKAQLADHATRRRLSA